MVGLAMLLNLMLNDLLQVPQRSPSESRYIIDSGKLIYVQHGTSKRSVLSGVDKGTKFFQSGNVLIVADKKLQFYRGKELLHSTDSIPSRFFYEWDGNNIYCGFYDHEQVVIERYNRKNQIVKSDAVVGKQRSAELDFLEEFRVGGLCRDIVVIDEDWFVLSYDPAKETMIRQFTGRQHKFQCC